MTTGVGASRGRMRTAMSAFAARHGRLPRLRFYSSAVRWGDGPPSTPTAHTPLGGDPRPPLRKGPGWIALTTHRPSPSHFHCA